MATIVPEENRVGIVGLTDARFRAADYGGSGLEALGAGLVKVGDGGEELATALDKKRRRDLLAAAQLGDDHQHTIDDAAVKKAYVEHSDRADLALRGVDGLLNRGGVDAYKGFPEAVQRLAESHDQAMAPLTETQRGMAATMLADRLRKDIAVAGSHVHRQGAFEQRAQNDRRQEVAARNAVENLDDPALHDHHMAIGEKAVRQQALNEHMPDDERDRQVADYRSSVYAASIAALAAREPRQAAAWYAGVGGVLNAPDRRRAEAALTAASLGASPSGETASEADEQDLDAVPTQPSITPAASDDVGMPGAEDIAEGIRGAPGQGPSAPPPAPATPQAIPVPAGKFARNWPLLTPGQPDVADYGSAVHADTIHALNEGNPPAAADWLGRFGGMLNERDRNRVEAILGRGGYRAAVPGGSGVVGAAGGRADGAAGDQPSRMKVFTLTPPAPAATRRTKPLTAQDRAFLENNYAAASAVARKLHVDVNLLLGVSALESRWSTSPQFRGQKNPFGATLNGSTPVTYPSIAAAWEKWGEQWGPRVVGVGNDADLFTTRLQTDNRKAVGAVDRRGKYNSATPAAWKKAVMDTIASVRRRTARWDGAAE